MSTPTAPTSQPNVTDDPLSDTSLGTRVKVCGIVEPTELDVLAARGVDFVGLWWGVPGGPHDLELAKWRGLAETAASTEGLTPVLVTFAKDAERLRETLEGSPSGGSSSTAIRRRGRSARSRRSRWASIRSG